MPTTTWVEGATAPKRFRIRDKDGVAVDLTGKTVTLVLAKFREPTVTVSTTGDVTVVDPTDGIIAFAPDAGDLRAVDSPLSARFKIEGSDIAYAPEEDADALQWLVRPVSL